MKKIFCSAVALLLSVFLVSVPSSMAAETGPFYVGIFGGYTFASDAEWSVIPFASFEMDVQETWAMGAKFGYTPPSAKFFAVELEYFYLNPDIDRSVLAASGGDFAAVEGDATAHSFMLNFIVKYPEGRFHPYLGLGLGFSYVDLSGTSTTRVFGVTRTSSLDDNDTSFAAQILAGVNIEINKNWSADITYRWFTTEPEFEGGDVDYTTNLITVGVNYHF